jgi:hypothetical protein
MQDMEVYTVPLHHHNRDQTSSAAHEGPARSKSCPWTCPRKPS